ncbi:MAG: hypothetical protein NTZ62_04355 [Actinobacteria bacterium]|nr:hypothetical protein [Actinomycetota bacterium]
MPRIAPITCAVLLTLAPFGLSAAHAADTPPDSTVAEVTDSTYVYDLVNEPSECINSNPRPDCGKKPQSSGDRGGWMQYTVFLVMIAGVGVVSSVLIRNVIRRDRAIAEKMSQNE